MSPRNPRPVLGGSAVRVPVVPPWDTHAFGARMAPAVLRSLLPPLSGGVFAGIPALWNFPRWGHRVWSTRMSGAFRRRWASLQSLGRHMETNGAVVVILAVLVGVGGLWFCAKLRHRGRGCYRCDERRALRSRPSRSTPRYQDAPRTGRCRTATASASRLHWVGNRTRHGVGANVRFRPSSPTLPRSRLQVSRHPFSPEDRVSPASPASLVLDDTHLHCVEESIADCMEAIRVDRGSPRLHLERARCHAKLNRYEEAVADYDRAIRLNTDHAAVYLGRCHATSELRRKRRKPSGHCPPAQPSERGRLAIQSWISSAHQATALSPSLSGNGNLPVHILR